MNTTLKSLMMSLLVSQFSYICGAVIGDIPYMYIVYLWVDLKIRRKENKSINQMLTDADRLNANFFSPCIYIIHICLLFALKKYHKFYSHRLGVSKKKRT